MLTYTEKFNDASLNITVIYDAKNNDIEQVMTVTISKMGIEISVSDLFMDEGGISEMDVAVDKIISRVDWRELSQIKIGQHD